MYKRDIELAEYAAEVHGAKTHFTKSLLPVVESKNINIIATGYMVHTAQNIIDTLKKENYAVGLYDAFCLPLDILEIEYLLKNSKYVIPLEEHVATGGLGATILQMALKLACNVPIKTYALDLNDGFCHTYGARNLMHERHGISKKILLNIFIPINMRCFK